MGDPQRSANDIGGGDDMRMRRCLTSALALAAAGLFVAGPVSAANLQRLSAEFQNNTSIGGSGEIFTTLPALAGGAGGTVVYDKTVAFAADVDVLYVTFSAQGDSHLGSALLMNATVNGNLIEPLAGQTAGGGGGPHVQTGWYTLLILPTTAVNPFTPANNCNDGGGGTADCHDNTIYFSGCYALQPADDKKTARVKIKLADLPGGDANFAFYERSTIYIDGQHDPRGELCKGVGTGPH